jgi:hypothetical protein
VPIPTLGFYYRQHGKSQLASLSDSERAYGHAWVMERMCRAFLERTDLLDAHGNTLFWSALSALRACRAFDVPWRRLSLLSHMITEVAWRQPPGLRRSRFATMVRRMGTQRAEVLSRLWTRSSQPPVYRTQWPSDEGETSRRVAAG